LGGNKIVKKTEKLDEKDVGLAEDLVFALQNLTAAEHHCMRSYDMTKNEKYKKLGNRLRKVRSKAMGILVTNPEAHTWCFTPETMIITDGGLKAINNIKIGEEVLTHKGNLKKVKKVFKREINEEIVSIKTNYSNIQIDVTKNHPFFVADNLRQPQKENWKKNYVKPKFVWKNASDLCRNDFLYLPRYSNEKDIDEINLEYDNGVGFSDSKTIPINEEMMTMIGLYLAEGNHCEGKNHFGHPAGGVAFSFSLKEEHLAKKIQDDFYKYFDSKIKLHHRESTIELSSGKRIVRKFFNQFGGYAHTKKIPGWVINLPEPKLIHLVKAMIEGDGHISKYDVSYATVSPELAFAFRLVLNKLGIFGSISKNKIPKKNSVINGREIIVRHPLYYVRISGDSARNLCEKLGIEYSGGKKTSGNFGYTDEDYFLIPVLSVEKKNYMGSVYNLEVEEDNSYCTFNGAVHNCLSKHILNATQGFLEVGNRFAQTGQEEAEFFLHESAELEMDVIELNGFLEGEIEAKSGA